MGSASNNFGMPKEVNDIVAPLTGLRAIEQISKTGASMANAPKDAAADKGLQEKVQASQAAAIEQKLATQPKNVAPDDFLANKQKMLANMRLGLASTISAPGGNPGSLISSPSLSGSANGKRTLGG